MKTITTIDEIIGLQIIVYGSWEGFHFVRATHSLAGVYDWYLWLGFIEIRKWHKLNTTNL